MLILNIMEPERGDMQVEAIWTSLRLDNDIFIYRYIHYPVNQLLLKQAPHFIFSHWQIYGYSKDQMVV